MEQALLKKAVPLLLEWYALHKRELPWREGNDPYHIWVSEIMLQQTRVEAVKEYYKSFLTRFPTVERLALASEEEVLKAWEGLGYYSRARNLHKAAKVIAQEGFPTRFEGVRALPGVGDYTAGAICSIAYGLPCPAVDGNVLRVLTRLLANESNIDEQRTKTEFAQKLKEVYPKEASDFCQGLMELGAIVCVPNGAPLCERCPWQKICLAHLQNREESFPVRKEKKARIITPVSLFVLKHNGKYALQKRENKGLLAGLWQFPLIEGEVDGAQFGRVEKSKKAKHVFTHIEWHITGYLVDADEAYGDYLWLTAEEIFSSYALPSAFKAYFSWLK